MAETPIAVPKILYVLDLVDLGGGETSFLAFMERARGTIDPFVVVPARGPLTEALDRLGIGFAVIPFALRFRRGLLPAWRPGPARAIEALARRIGPALIHVFHFFGLLYAGPAARRLGLPLVWTCHGDFELSNPLRRWAARRWATHAACVSESARAAAAAALGPERVSINHLGILPFAAAGASVTRAAIRAELAHPPAGLAELPGVFNLDVQGTRVHCEVDSDQLDGLLNRLTTYGVRSLVSQPPTLEDLFLHHYQTEGGRRAAGGTP